MLEIAEMIETVLSNVDNEEVIAQVRARVNETMKKYPIFAYKLTTSINILIKDFGVFEKALSFFKNFKVFYETSRPFKKSNRKVFLSAFPTEISINFYLCRQFIR